MCCLDKTHLYGGSGTGKYFPWYFVKIKLIFMVTMVLENAFLGTLLR